MHNNSIEAGIDAYGDWRGRLRAAVLLWRNWLRDEKLADPQSEQRFEQVLSSLQDDRLYVAFVAEFSRGKSELINAIFFGEVGQRLLPSSAGRTTMCPTELLCEEDARPALRLLPIETRASGSSIAELRNYPEEWVVCPLNPGSPADMAADLGRLTEVKTVTRAQARDLGLAVADDPSSEDGMPVNAEGQVEVPRWRHAIVQFPHPLLRRGLVLLDTPGLNALGAEPELTLNLLAGAHAVIFVLAADTGVTKSDLRVWRDHIATGTDAGVGRLVVLNKTDVLWDELRDAAEVTGEIRRQIQSTARVLGVPEDHILPVSAQKALLGKVRGDAALVENSGIRPLERALADLLVPAKRDIVRQAVRGELAEAARPPRMTLEQRLRDVHEHIGELDGLNDRNIEVIEDIMNKVQFDKDNLERNLQRFQATRAVFTQHTGRLYGYLSGRNLDRLTAQTKKEMATSLTTAGLRASVIRFFDACRTAMESAAREAGQIQALMDGVYSRLHEEHGMPMVQPRGFSIARHQRELRRLEQNHEHFTGGLSMVMTEQMVLTRRFYETVATAMRELFQRANRDAESWVRSVMAPMESQVREHQTQLRRRLESIKRIHRARDTLDDRLAELRHVQEGIRQQAAQAEEMRQRVEAILDEPEAGAQPPAQLSA